MKVLICAFGSYGDILPFVAIGREMQSRGHNVRFYASAIFEHQVKKAGLDISVVNDCEDYEAAANSSDVARPIKAWRRTSEYLEKFLRLSYRAMAADVSPEKCVVVGSTLAFSTRSLRETHHVPCATVHLYTTVLRSESQLPRFTTHKLGQYAPRFLEPIVYSIFDNLFGDRIIGTKLNRHRSELGLSPVRRVFHKWIHSTDVNIGMFPEWYAFPQSDRPASIQLTGFPLYDGDETCALANDVEAFLRSGSAPVAFTAGSHTAAPSFFTASIEACQRSGRRGILLTRYADKIPGTLPDGIARFDYVPFRALLPRLTAFVHHGGIGTTSLAMLAGVPQLIRPTAFDQFDNAYRATRLGVAHELSARRYTASTVAASLDQLVGDKALKVRCAQLAREVERDAVTRTCDLILSGTNKPNLQ